METITIAVYGFDELTTAAQQKSLEANRDINLSYNWWEAVYEDARNAGLLISGFYLFSTYHIRIGFIAGAEEAVQLILANHGDSCDTYRYALAFRKTMETILAKGTLLSKTWTKNYCRLTIACSTSLATTI